MKITLTNDQELQVTVKVLEECLKEQQQDLEAIKDIQHYSVRAEYCRKRIKMLKKALGFFLEE